MLHRLLRMGSGNLEFAAWLPVAKEGICLQFSFRFSVSFVGKTLDDLLGAIVTTSKIPHKLA